MWTQPIEYFYSIVNIGREYKIKRLVVKDMEASTNIVLIVSY